MPSSTVNGLPYPSGSTANAVPTHMSDLIAVMDTGSVVKRLTQAQIDALTSAQKPAGLVVYNTTASRLQESNGSTFVDLVLMASPVGEVKVFAGASAPSGYLLCDGAAVSRATYAALYAVVGTTYGVGDGSTTFNLPNLKGRVPAGRDASQSEFDTLGETGGAKTHTLSLAETPSHNHGGATGNQSATHTHTPSGGAYFATSTLPPDASGSGGSYPVTTAATATTSTESANHTHSIASNGSGSAHNNLQPYLVMNYIIRAV